MNSLGSEEAAPISIATATSDVTASMRDRSLRAKLDFPSGLDFERVVNSYSIEATRERLRQRRQRERHGQKPILEEDEEGDRDEKAEENGEPSKPLIPLSKQTSRSRYSTFSSESSVSKEAPQNTVPLDNILLDFAKARSITRWILIISTGLLTGFVAVLVVYCTEIIQNWHADHLDTQWQRHDEDRLSVWIIFAYFAVSNLVLAVASSALCLFVCPEAIGSGIPEVKAYLNGVRVKRFNSMKLLLVKIFGTILSVSSGLALGKEGPSVHIGAILGASCTKVSGFLLRNFSQSTLLRFVASHLSHFSSDAERRDLVSIGAATGFAASFGAPIGGLLFALEAASSFYETPIFLRTLVATAVGTFCMALYHRDLSNYSIISLGHYDTPNEDIFANRIEEIPLYILIGVVGGIMGGVFTLVWEKLQKLRARKLRSTRSRLVEVSLISLLTSTLIYCIPLMSWACQSINEEAPPKSWKARARQYDCPDGYVNEIADILFGSRLSTISGILTDPDQFRPSTLLTVGLLFFPLMTITLGCSLPFGSYTPTFLVGTALGGFAGQIFEVWLGDQVSASTFALLGAASLLVSIQRSTVSHVVILVEGTGQVKVLVPVIFTAVIARTVAAAIHEDGLFSTGVRLKHYPYLHHRVKKAYDIIQVHEIMSAAPKSIGPREHVGTLVTLLRESHHNGFPVIDPMSGRLLGLARRDQLVALLECGIFEPDVTNESSIGDQSRLGWETSSTQSGSSRGALPGHRRGNTYDSILTGRSNSPHRPAHKRHRSINNSPMYHLAYHIKDDRYDYMKYSSPHISKQPNKIPRHHNNDSYDQNAWYQTIHESIRLVKQQNGDNNIPHTVVLSADRTMPLAVRSDSAPADFQAKDDQSAASAKSGFERFAVVGTNERGSVFVESMPSEYYRHWVDVAAVMNQGVYTVTDFCPVSKAYHLFAVLGLRHLIVLGGEGGGMVVGILTRINFLKEYIEERTEWSQEK